MFEYNEAELEGAAKRAAELLMEKGWFLDEEGTFAHSVIEKRIRKIDAHVRKFGYRGGPLDCAAKFYPEHGQVAIGYDSNRITSERVIQILDQWVRDCAKR